MGTHSEAQQRPAMRRLYRRQGSSRPVSKGSWCDWRVPSTTVLGLVEADFSVSNQHWRTFGCLHVSKNPQGGIALRCQPMIGAERGTRQRLPAFVDGLLPGDGRLFTR